MKLSEWARRNGVHYQTAWQWARDGKMPVPVIKTATGRYLVLEQHAEPAGRTVAYCRVSAQVTTIVVEHRDRLARFGLEHLTAALEATGRRIVVLDNAEVDDDLVGDMTEVLTWFCARLYGRRSAARRAKAAMRAAGEAA